MLSIIEAVSPQPGYKSLGNQRMGKVVAPFTIIPTERTASKIFTCHSQNFGLRSLTHNNGFTELEAETTTWPSWAPPIKQAKEGINWLGWWILIIMGILGCYYLMMTKKDARIPKDAMECLLVLPCHGSIVAKLLLQ